MYVVLPVDGIFVVCRICAILTGRWGVGLVKVVVREFRKFKEFSVYIMFPPPKLPNFSNFPILPNYIKKSVPLERF